MSSSNNNIDLSALVNETANFPVSEMMKVEKALSHEGREAALKVLRDIQQRQGNFGATQPKPNTQSLPSTEGNAGAHPSAIEGGEPPFKKAKLEGGDAKEVKTKFFQDQDIWMQILGFVGPGHYAYVAGVSKQFKEWYITSFDAIEKRPMVKAVSVFFDWPWYTYDKRPARHSDTFYQTAFSNVACANFWKESTAGDVDILPEDKVCATVVRHGNLDVLKWARRMDFPWKGETCAIAAKFGHLEILKYLHQNGCPWDSTTPYAAAGNGHLEVLKYCYKEGCPSRSNRCNEAAQNGQLSLIEYLNDNGWMWRGGL